MSIFNKDGKYQSRRWSEIFFDMFEIFKDRMTYAVQRQRARTAKKIISVVLLSVGLIFFLNGLAAFIGKIISGDNWSGYLIVGILMIAVGYFINNKSV